MKDMSNDVEPFLFYKADRNKVILFTDILRQAVLYVALTKIAFFKHLYAEFIYSKHFKSVFF